MPRSDTIIATNRFCVLDSDIHIIEPPDLWTVYRCAVHDDIHLAFLQLGCALISLRFLG